MPHAVGIDHQRARQIVPRSSCRPGANICIIKCATKWAPYALLLVKRLLLSLWGNRSNVMSDRPVPEQQFETSGLIAGVAFGLVALCTIIAIAMIFLR